MSYTAVLIKGEAGGGALVGKLLVGAAKGGGVIYVLIVYELLIYCLRHLLSSFVIRK